MIRCCRHLRGSAQKDSSQSIEVDALSASNSRKATTSKRVATLSEQNANANTQGSFDWMLTEHGGALTRNELRQASEDIQFGRISCIVVVQIEETT